MKNKRGLSAIIATLIIILLVLVAVGIIWVVVRNVIQGGAEQVDISTKCMAVDVRAVSVNETSSGIYDVALKRFAGGEDIAGVKVALFSDTDNSGVLDFGIALDELQTSTQSVNTSEGIYVTGANKLEFTVYFKDESGNEVLCSQTGSFTF